MRIKILLFLVVLLVIMPLTGCWDAIEISNHKIISLVGVDKIGDNFKFFLQYRLSDGGTSDNIGSSGGNSKILTGEGKNFADARESYLKRSSNDVFIGSVRALVFSDSLSKDGITEYLSRLRGMYEYRRTITIFTTTSEIEKLFTTKESSANGIGYDIEHLSEQLLKNGLLYNGTVSDVLENICVPYAGYLLSNIDTINGEIAITGYSIFKNNKKVGLIKSDKMKGVNYLILKKSSGDYVVDIDGVKASISTQVKKKNIEAFYNGEDIAFNINISVNLQILYLSEQIKLEKEKVKELEEKVSTEIKRDIIEVIKTSQSEYECDYFFFYKYFRAKYNTDFKQMNWNDKYKDAQFNVDIKTKIVPGNLVNFNKAR